MKKSYQDNIKKTKELINNADLVLIGAGAGLSTAAGLEYSGDRFVKHFEEHIKKYKLTDMYSSGFYNFKTLEEKWSYWSKHIKVNRFDNEKEAELYKTLHSLVEDKEHFVLTTNVDGLFYKAGFDKDKVFMIQGDYGKLQCSKPCHNKLYDNKELILQMVKNQKNCKIESFQIPKCPICTSHMEINIRKDSSFLEDEHWEKSYKKYEKFINSFSNKNIVFLELGVGFNTPSIIKFPFEKMASNNKNIKLIRVNRSFYESLYINEDEIISFEEDIKKVISDTKETIKPLKNKI